MSEPKEEHLDWMKFRAAAVECGLDPIYGAVLYLGLSAAIDAAKAADIAPTELTKAQLRLRPRWAIAASSLGSIVSSDRARELVYDSNPYFTDDCWRVADRLVG